MKQMSETTRELRADELDAVTGGAINGCIRGPRIPFLPLQPRPGDRPRDTVQA
jgi:hypothetical protein